MISSSQCERLVGDGLVDAADYVVWRDAIVQTAPTLRTDTPVPDPSTILLAALALLSLAGRFVASRAAYNRNVYGAGR